MAAINVNTDAVENMAERIRAAGKHAMPNAVRGTLNSLAFDMKKNTLPKSAKDTFEQRQKTFIKAFSRVNVAKGNDIEKMQSEVGFIDRGAKSQQAVENLEKQEHGGRIAGRAFIPLETSRVGKSRGRMVSAKNRLGRIGRVVHSEDANGKNRQEKFFKSMIFVGVGGAVVGNFEPNVVYRVTSIKKVKGKLRVRKTPLYTYDKGRTVKVTATKFSENAANNSASKARDIWIGEGNRAIRRTMYR